MVSELIEFVLFGLAVWVGLKGNEMTAKTLLAQGWQMMEPQSEAGRYAMRQWGLATEDVGAWH